MAKRIPWLLIIAVVVLSVAACCTKEQCKTRYNLVEPAGPGGGSGGGPGGGPPGPIITLEPPSPGSTSLEWKVDSTTQQSSGSSIYPNCQLRWDFIGDSIVKFNYYETPASAPQPADHVIVSSDDHVIEIRRISGQIHWTVKEQVSNPQVCGGPIREYPHDANKLPPEFFNLKSATLEEAKLNLSVHKIEIQIKPKTPPSP